MEGFMCFKSEKMRSRALKTVDDLIFQYYTPANQIGGPTEQEQAHSNTHTQV